MHVKFKKLAVASAVSAALGVAGTAQAENSLLFPYVNTASTAYTFISLWNDPSNGFPAGLPPHAARNYHFYYGTKAIGAAATSACSHLDFPVSVTEGALLQFEVGTRFNLVADFGDPVGYGATINNANNKVAENREGFLIVESTGAVGNMDRVYGEASMVNTATGVSLAYRARDARAAVNADWSLRRDQDGDTVRVVLADATFSGMQQGHSEYVTSWFPRHIVTTTWYVLPLGTRAAMTPNLGGGINARITPSTNAANPGAFSRGEFYTSGSVPNNLRCFGSFGVDNLLTASFNTGGWMSVIADQMNATFAATVATGRQVPFQTHAVSAGAFEEHAHVQTTTANTAAYEALATTTRQPVLIEKFQVTSALGSSVTTLSAIQPRQNALGTLAPTHGKAAVFVNNPGTIAAGAIHAD